MNCQTRCAASRYFALAAQLAGVDKSNHRFGLRPAFLAGINYSSTLAFVAQRAIGGEALAQHRFRHGKRDGADLFEQLRVVQNFGGFAQQPTRLDVVAECVGVRAHLPLLVEEMVQMPRARVENARPENFDQFAQSLRHARILPDAIEIRPGLQHVQMVVHGLLLALVLVAEPRFRPGPGPVASANLDVAVKLRVVRVAFDQPKQFLRPGERGRGVEGAMKFRQRVNIKCLAINFLRVVQHLTAIIEPPERAAMLRVPKLVHGIIKRALGHPAMERIRPRLVHGGERPENAAVNDQTLGLRAVGCQIVGQPGHPAALLVIHRRAAPEWQDVVKEVRADALRQLACKDGLRCNDGGLHFASCWISTREICASPVNSIFMNRSCLPRGFTS